MTEKKDRRRIGIELARAHGRYTQRDGSATNKGYRKANPEQAKALKAQGLTHREIAAQLGVCIVTVGRYLKIR